MPGGAGAAASLVSNLRRRRGVIAAMSTHMATTHARRAIVAGLASALIAGLGAGTAAASTFHVGGDLSDEYRDARDPRVAVNATDDQAFMWQLADFSWEVQGRLRTGGTLGPVHTLSESGYAAQHPRVAVLPNGDGLFAWNRYDETSGHRIEARTLSTADVLGPVHTLSEIGGTSETQVAVDADGDALIAWHRWDGERHSVEARTLSAAGVPGAAVLQISPEGEDAVRVQVAFDADGDAVLAWTNDDQVQTRTLTAAGELGEIQDVSDGSYDAWEMQMAVAPDGDALYTWERLGVDGRKRIKLRSRSADGELGEIEEISAFAADADQPEIGVDAEGDAVITWLRENTGGDQVQARTRTADGTLGSILTLSNTGDPHTHPQLAVSANGVAAIAWQRDDGYDTRIKTRKLYPGDILGATATLSDAGVDADELVVAINAQGSAVHAWRRLGDYYTIEFDADCCGAIPPPDAIVDRPQQPELARPG